jgi:hypothetical protein
MLKTIEFHYPIISHFREQYLKLLPHINKLKEDGVPVVYSYENRVYCPVFGDIVTCFISINYQRASINFKSNKLYKGDFEALVSMSDSYTPSNAYSVYDGYHLRTYPNISSPYYFVKANHPYKSLEMLHENNSDDLETMEFMLMSLYNMNDLTAILLNQVLINEKTEIEKYTFCIAPFIGLGEEREQSLTELYHSTVLGLVNDASKVS